MDARRRSGVEASSSSTSPRGRDGARALATLAMTCYWNVGQKGFFDVEATADEALELGTPLGFEPLIGDGGELRRRCAREFGNLRVNAWLNGVDEGNGRTTRAGVLTSDDWVIVAFRGTTPSPLRGLIFESQINGRAGQTTWASGAGRVHAGYAAAYETLRTKLEDAVRAEMDASGGSKKLVVTGHSLGGALATLCAARLASEYGPQGARVDAVTFGQPRVGDNEFAKYLDQDLSLDYARVVHGGDLFSRVPTSGYWLPTANEGRFDVEYTHAGSMLWTNANKNSLTNRHIYAPKNSGDPDGFSTDSRMINPVTVARHHSGYANFFQEDPSIFDAWPATGTL